MYKKQYDNYDYEEAYKEQCEKLEEAEAERIAKKQRGQGIEPQQPKRGR